MFGFDKRLLIESIPSLKGKVLCDFLKEMDDVEKEAQIFECSQEKAVDEYRFYNSIAYVCAFAGTLFLAGCGVVLYGSPSTDRKGREFALGLGITAIGVFGVMAMCFKKASEVRMVNAYKHVRLKDKKLKIIERLKIANVSPDEKIQLRRARNALQNLRV